MIEGGEVWEKRERKEKSKGEQDRLDKVRGGIRGLETELLRKG